MAHIWMAIRYRSMESLRAVLAPFTNERLFWLDTLCIPADKAHKDVRYKAINMMDSIYSDASEVLVLDAELQNICGGKDTVLGRGEGLIHHCTQALDVPRRDRLSGILAHMLCSNWMRRAWTLQENMLTRNYLFQLWNGMVNYDYA
ncbi:hypothetical protein NA56DRAFT_754346 [Hyaloscypha hepaticicola]|uniref:Heterokaryon incompatibility domain-containing protein n=1 Tax=Hyaloscypha hepaticicola TaxID=2082293 RepID=A0A2J6PMK2_9HELO|nr:hypothetical protein NA56DRAFT_754346 [Hyaloscypha hepaticicola]